MWGGGQELAEREMAADEEDYRTIDELLIEQVEFADVLVISKPDLVSSEELETLQALLRRLNPHAEQVVAQNGRVDVGKVLATGRFNFERAATQPGWLRVMRGEESSESDEYGVGSFVYRARRPFHPERLAALLDQDWSGVMRSKGWFWLASRNDQVGTWQQAGGVCGFGGAGDWWAASPQEEWPEDPEHRAEIEASWEEPHGDRRQEIVIIGVDVDQEALSQDLNSCLLTEEEMGGGPQLWGQLPDPFGEWTVIEGLAGDSAGD